MGKWVGWTQATNHCTYAKGVSQCLNIGVLMLLSIYREALQASLGFKPIAVQKVLTHTIIPLDGKLGREIRFDLSEWIFWAAPSYMDRKQFKLLHRRIWERHNKPRRWNAIGAPPSGIPSPISLKSLLVLKPEQRLKLLAKWEGPYLGFFKNL